MKDGNSQITFDDLIDVGRLPDDERREKLRILFDVLYGSDMWQERFERLSAEAVQHKDFILDVLSAAQKIQNMPEDEARKKLQPIWDELQLHPPADMTLIPSDDSFQYAISKVAQRQRAIALPDDKGDPQGITDITVDQKGTRVTVEITTATGKPLFLSAFDKQIQDVCGDIVRRAGKGATVSAKQIYREFAKLPNDEDITTAQEQQVIESMDRQAATMADLDFAEQIANHEHIKQQKDFEYKAAKANIHYALIPCKRMTIFPKNGGSLVGYELYDYPALYFYSHVVNQIATAPTRLLTTFGKAIDNPKKKSVQKPYRSTQQTELRRYLLERIGNMMREYKAHRKPKTQIILLDEIFTDFNEPLTPQTSRTMRKNIELILNAWTESPEETNIQSWDYQQKKGTRGIDGYKITLYAPPVKKKTAKKEHPTD